MERTRRLQQLWSWLPAFRAVAETEHLPSAAQQLNVTPSALSRTVKVLEEDLGLALFERRGRRLVLNDHGRELLSSLRDAMRLLDDGLTRLQETTFRGALRIAAPSAFASVLVVPVMETLRSRHPQVVPHLSAASAELANAGLVDGSLDLALLDDPLPHPEISCEKLADLDYGVYCGEGHPLVRRRKLAAKELSEHPFVTPPVGGDDHWPVHWQRTISARVSQLHLGLEICAQGGLLAVLPRLVADAYAGPGRLHRLPVELPEDTALYLLCRNKLGERPLLDEAMDELRAKVAEANTARRPRGSSS